MSSLHDSAPARTVLLVGPASILKESLAAGARRQGFLAVKLERPNDVAGGASDTALCLFETAQSTDDGIIDSVKLLLKNLRGVPLVLLVERLRPSTVALLMRHGVVDVIDVPAPAVDVLARALAQVRRSVYAKAVELEAIVGESEPIRRVREKIATVAPTEARVLLTGETGTGKGLAARVVHELSGRQRGPFVHVDCSVLAPTVIESELFGHERGAFTGATEQRRGRFELAENGTIFLDEIGELDGGLQAKLLRVLQERHYERIGGMKTLATNARVVAGTNRDLAAAVRDGRFRRDLYYRLNVFEIRLPALREHISDISVLVRRSLDELARRLAVRAPRVSDGFYARLALHTWPGNVRELLNVLERCLIELRVDTLEAGDLDEMFEDSPAADAYYAAGVSETAMEIRDDYPDAGPDEKRYLAKALHAAGWNVTRAARRLGMARGTLRYKLQRYGLEDLLPKD